LVVAEPLRKERLVLIDGHSLVYRAFFALPSLTDRDGRMVNAAYGFTSMLLLALQEHPDYVLASFDLGGVTFRHKALAQYKATRRPTPPELSPQFPLTRDIVRAFGIPIYEVKGVEADDVIGTLSTQARARGLHSTIVTGDLDALQLVNEDVDVLTSKRGVSETILYTPERVRERYGLEPIQTVDLKGLVGDVSDNIPGIRGIGEKTAIKLIQEFGSVEALVENWERVTPLKVKKLIEEHREQALLSKKMATIVRDVDITLDITHGSAKDYRPQAARTLLADLGFRSLAARVPDSWRDGSAMSAPPILAPAPAGNGRPAQETLAFESTPGEAVTVVGQPAELERVVAAVEAAERVGFQVVTLDETPRRGRIAALVIGLDEHQVFYIPVAHEQEPCLEMRNVLQRFARSLESPTPSKIGFNQKADYLALRAHEIQPRGLDCDLLIGAYLLNSGIRSPSLEALASDVLHRVIEGPESLFGSGKTALTCDQVEIARAAAFYGTRMRVVLELAPTSAERAGPPWQREAIPRARDAAGSGAGRVGDRRRFRQHALPAAGLARAVRATAAARSGDRGRGARADQRQLPAAARPVSIRGSRTARRTPDEERLLNGCQCARGVARPAPGHSKDPGVPPVEQAQGHLRRRAAAAGRRADSSGPYLVQSDHRGHGPALVVRSQPAEHPDSDGGRPEGAPGLRAQPRRRRAPFGGLLPDRVARAGAHD